MEDKEPIITDIDSYADLLEALKKLTPEQLEQPVQIVKPSPHYLKDLLPALAIGTVEDMGFDGCRSVVDNRYHKEDVVILTDHNPFGRDGATLYQMNEDGSEIPIYGKGGKTEEKDQLCHELAAEQLSMKKAEERGEDVDADFHGQSFSPADVAILKNRTRERE